MGHGHLARGDGCHGCLGPPGGARAGRRAGDDAEAPGGSAEERGAVAVADGVGGLTWTRSTSKQIEVQT